MSRPIYSSPAVQPARWPIYDPYSTQKRKEATPLTTPGQYSSSLQSSRTSLKAVSQKHQSAPAPSQSTPAVYQVWIPPSRPASPDDEPAWSQRIGAGGDSTSTTSTSSDDDEESPAETSLPLVPKATAPSIAALEKDLEEDLFTQSHLSTIFVPMASPQLQAARAGSNPGTGPGAGAMQLLAYRSPSVRYDKGLHGAFSPATTVHLALPHAAAIRTQGKPRLPLPASAKAMPRPLQPQQRQQQNTPLPLHRQQQRPRVISQPPPQLVTSPPVIGLDLALMPPADHRDSAMSPRNSMAVKTPARPSLLAPVEIPRRVSIGSTQAHTIWKPVSAPTPSPISEGPPQPSVITQAARDPSPVPTPNDTHKLSKPPSTSSVSINSSIGSVAPSIAPPASNNSSVTALNNERAEIRARTLSSTNLAQRFKSDPLPPAPSQSRDVSPNLTVQPLDNSAEAAPTATPALASRPAPTPLQPAIMFPTDEIEFDERPAPLRVINVTSEFGTDSMATVPIANHVSSEIPVPQETTRPPSPLPDITVVPSTPPKVHQFFGPPYSSNHSNRASVSPAPSPTVAEAQSNSPKHTSLPPPARPPSHSTPLVHTTRISLDDTTAPASYSGQSERRPVSRAPRLPPPGARTWLPRTLTVPTPLSPTSALPQQPTPPQPFPSQQQQAARRVSATQQQPSSRYQHAHSLSDPPPTPMRSHRPIAAPAPPFASSSNGYYSSDDDDPSKWAPYPDPEAPSSRRSSRSSRSSSYSRNSRYSNRNSIYGPHAESEEEDGGLLYAPPSISLPNLRPILQGPGESEQGPAKKITFAVPPSETNKPSQAAGGRKRIRRRSNSTDSVLRGPKQIPWLQESDIPKRGGNVTVPDPFGYSYADEGRYDVVNHPELVPADVYSRYVRPDGGPKLPEYRETFAAKNKALRAAAEEEQRARILGRRTRTPAVSVESEDEVPITVPVCLRRPRAVSDSSTAPTGNHGSGHGHSGGSKLRRRSRSRDRAADWAPPPTIPDPEIPAYPLYSMPPATTSLFPNALERMFSKLRR